MDYNCFLEAESTAKEDAAVETDVLESSLQQTAKDLRTKQRLLDDECNQVDIAEIFWLVLFLLLLLFQCFVS